jgi:hypothetical protein
MDYASQKIEKQHLNKNIGAIDRSRFSVEPFPNLLANQHYPTYPQRNYKIEQLQLDYVEQGFTPSLNKPRDERSKL